MISNAKTFLEYVEAKIVENSKVAGENHFTMRDTESFPIAKEPSQSTNEPGKCLYKLKKTAIFHGRCYNPKVKCDYDRRQYEDLIIKTGIARVFEANKQHVETYEDLENLEWLASYYQGFLKIDSEKTGKVGNKNYVDIEVFFESELFNSEDYAHIDAGNVRPYSLIGDFRFRPALYDEEKPLGELIDLVFDNLVDPFIQAYCL